MGQGGVSNEQIYGAIMRLTEDVGGLKSATINNHEFTTAVSRKINAHVEDSGAHGAGGGRRVWSDILGWGVLIVGVLELFFMSRGK